MVWSCAANTRNWEVFVTAQQSWHRAKADSAGAGSTQGSGHSQDSWPKGYSRISHITLSIWSRTRRRRRDAWGDAVCPPRPLSHVVEPSCAGVMDTRNGVHSCHGHWKWIPCFAVPVECLYLRTLGFLQILLPPRVGSSGGTLWVALWISGAGVKPQPLSAISPLCHLGETKHWWKWMFFWSTSQLEKVQLRMESSQKSDVTQFLLVNPSGGIYSLPLSPSESTLIFPAGAQLCPSGSQIFWKLFLGCSRRHLGHKGWQKKAQRVKREEAGTEETLLCSLVVARASWLGGEDDSHQISWEQPGTPEHHHSRHLAQQWGQNRAH